jgi:DNA-binding NarL/FixJ family response regulator
MGDDDRSEPEQTPRRAAGEPSPSTTQTDGMATASGEASDPARAEDRTDDRRLPGARSRVLPFGAQSTQVSLTRRERQVVGLIAEGLTNRQIAERLTLSVRTVERHIANIYDRLGCTGKAGRAIATAYAIRHGLTPPAKE